MLHCVKNVQYGVFSGRYFPVFGLNTRKNEPEQLPYLETFHAVSSLVHKRKPEKWVFVSERRAKHSADF